MPDENKDINTIVEEAFAAEEQAVEEVKPTEEAPAQETVAEEEPGQTRRCKEADRGRREAAGTV